MAGECLATKFDMDRYAVIGNPIEHTKSPQIHNAFAEQTGQELQYEKLLATPDTFEPTLRAFQKESGKGVNITVPFKEHAFSLCQELSDYAQAAKAVNTIIFKSPTRWIGANTDGLGLVQDLKSNLGLELYGRRVLIMGAGGAARGIILPLLNQSIDQITLANRTHTKAEQLASEFNVRASQYSRLAGNHFDLIINTTSAGLQNVLPPLPDGILSRDCTCYDLLYADTPTVFIEWARQQGAALAVDGLGMLIEQAAASFYLWRSIRPHTRPVFNLLRPNKNKT